MTAPGPLHHSITHNIVARLVLYYAGLAAFVLAVWAILPPGGRAVARSAFGALSGVPAAAASAGEIFGGAPATRIASNGSPALAVGIAVLVAFLLSVPVAWTYMWTRRMKGYRQSVVHSLILLPVVVAGVVVLVKSSLALAFSLAGIVAAVRFRNTLDDSKDAVFIFFATALGLAAAVQVDAAAVMSVLFIVIVLLLWYSDFARMPPGLEDARARRQLERAMMTANRTGEFVARVDREVLQAMAPAQLDALAARVRRRRAESDEDNAASSPDDDGVTPPTVEFTVHIVVSNLDAARALIEPVLERHCRRWSPSAQQSAHAGHPALDYGVSLRKRRTPAELTAAIEREAAPHVVRAEVLATAGA